MPTPAVRSAASSADLFVSWLADRFRPLADPALILRETNSALGLRLSANRVCYAQVEAGNETVEVAHDWTDGTVGSLSGRHSITALVTSFPELLERGAAFISRDVGSDPRVSKQQREVYASIDIAAILTVPLIKDGRLVALLSAQRSKPHSWSEEDERIVREVAERTWPTLEHAQALERLRRSA